jgi:hypothetical protein
MQSGHAKTKDGCSTMSPSSRAGIEPLMGWTSSGDMRQQLRLQFDTTEEAVAYCQRHGIAYQVSAPKASARRIVSCLNSFAFKRTDPGRTGGVGNQ